MPFPEFTPTLDEKFKFATFSLTRLNSESIFSLIVSSSSLTFTTPSFVSGSLVPQTTNPQTFDVYSVVSITGAGANPFTLNSDGTYNYQIPIPLPTTNLVLTYTVTRGSKTATATLTLIFNPFPLCTIEDPNTSEFNLKIYSNAGASNATVASINTFDGLSYPRLPITGASQSASVYSFVPAGTYSYYKWIPEDPTQTAGGGVVFLTPAAFKLSAIDYNSGTFRLSVNTTSGFRVFFISPSLSPNTEVIISHGATIDPTLNDFTMTIGGVPAIFTPATPGNGFPNSTSTSLAFNSRRAIGCFLAAVEKPADFKVTNIPVLNTTSPAIPLTTQTRETGASIPLSRIGQNSPSTLAITPLSLTYLRFRFVVTSVGNGSANTYCGWGHNSAQNTFASAITGGTLGEKMKISWYSAANTASAINYVPQEGSPIGTWDVIFSSPYTTPVVKHNGVIVTGGGNSGRHNANDHFFSWGSGLQSFEAWVD